MISKTIPTIQVPQHPDVWLSGTLYYHTDVNTDLSDPPSTPLLIYLHGGGLVYGTRNDLPKQHIDLFIELGYQVLCLDYPLLPSVSFDVLLETLEAYILWIDHHPKALLPFDTYDVFGRSAGAYLAFKWTETCITLNSTLMPRNLIAFYGYPSFVDNAFKSPHTRKMHQPISFSGVQSIFTDQVITDDPLLQRSILYAYLRQEGLWVETLMGIDIDVSEYDVNLNALPEFPRTFMTASVDDDDVPFSLGKKFFKALPQAVFHQVYGLPHDFDQQTQHPEVIKLMEHLKIWIRNKV